MSSDWLLSSNINNFSPELLLVPSTEWFEQVGERRSTIKVYQSVYEREGGMR